MTGHLHAKIIVITYNFISLKTSFFKVIAWTSFRDPSFDFEFETIERFRFFYFIGY